MGFLKRLYNWLRKIGPLWIIPITIAVYIVLPKTFNVETNKYNRIFEIVTESLGLLIVLNSMMSNYSLLTGKRQFQVIGNWLRSHPFRKVKNYTYNANGQTETIHISDSVAALVIRGDETIDQKVERLFEETRKLNIKIGNLRRDFNNDKKEQRRKTSQALDEIRSSISDVRGKLEGTTIGDIRLQYVGVFFIIFGLIL